MDLFDNYYLNHLIYDKKILLKIDSYEIVLSFIIILYMDNHDVMIFYEEFNLIYMLYRLLSIIGGVDRIGLLGGSGNVKVNPFCLYIFLVLLR